MKIFWLLLLITFSNYSQSYKAALKVYLEAAETNKNIKKAKVTIEGFEIPAIEGKYDKKCKCYYFTEIPKGYNTVMVYHKEYNEKGFQNIEGLPSELRLKLYNPLNVSYVFLKVPDSIYRDKKKKNVKNLMYKNFYVEDPYKIVLSADRNLNYEELKEFLKRNVNELNLEIELVNPSWERDKLDERPYNTTQKDAYPKIDANDSDELTGEFVFPLLSGLNNVQAMFDKNYSKKSKDICFVFRKKSGLKFKRFNDPIIKKLSDNGLIVYSMILNKKGEYDTAKFFSKSDFKYKDRLNKEFNVNHNIDSSKIFFYDNNMSGIKKKYGLLKRKQPYLQFDEPGLGKKEPSFILIGNDEGNVPEQFLYVENVSDEQIKIFVQQKVMGLGILDMYEYYFKEN